MKYCQSRFFVWSISFFITFFVSSTQAAIDTSEIVNKIRKVAVPFVKNQGQVDDDVSFYASTLGGTLYVTRSGELVYNFPKLEVIDSKIEKSGKLVKQSGGVVLREYLVDAKVGNITAQRKDAAKVSYFKGNDSSTWQRGISTFEELSLGEVYDGVELRLKAYGDNVEKLFHVRPGANPDVIKLAITGGDSLRILGSGELQVANLLGDVNFTRPVAWQKINGQHVPVTVAYDIISDNDKLVYAFQVGSYDKSCELIIDPLLASTYLGGASADYGQSITLDSSGNVYVAGYSLSNDYPTTTGAYDEVFNSNYDIIISKFSSDLSSLLASTYLGGALNDFGQSVTLDSVGNVYVVGMSLSSDYPIIAGAYDNSHNTGFDVVITKLSSDLSAPLLASTYLGGTGDDRGFSITLDNLNNVYVTGFSDSTDYPTTTGPVYDSLNDVIITKLSSDLSAPLLASTYLGGSGEDYSYSITLDSSGYIYVAGYSLSTDYPVTTGAYSETQNGFGDLIISKLSSAFTLLAATYLGGGSTEIGGNSIILDNLENYVYVTGYSNSVDYPTTPGAYDRTHNGSNDLVISKLPSALNDLTASTYLGGSGFEYGGFSMARDSFGNVYVVGYTDSSDYPTTAKAYNKTSNGSNDFIISRLNTGLTSLVASTYLGGTGDDKGFSIVLDSSGNVYVSGYGDSDDYPTTNRAYDRTHNAGYDLLISKIDKELSAPFPWPLFIPRVNNNRGGN